MLVLFGYALTLDVDNVPLVVWDQSDTARQPRADEPLRRLARTFASCAVWTTIATWSGPSTRGEALVAPGDSPRFRPAPSTPAATPPVQLIVDGSDSNTATIALGYADAIAQSYSQDLTFEQSCGSGGRGRRNPLGPAAAGVVQRGPGSRGTTSFPA